MPDIGDFDQVDVIEVLVAAGDTIAAEQSLITLESDKATMEIPAPEAGVVKELKVAVGDKIGQGAVILVLEPALVAAEEPSQAASSPAVAEAAPPPAAAVQQPAPAVERPPGEPPQAPPPVAPVAPPAPGSRPHASPAVRRFARELGVDLGRVSGSGAKGRVLKQDVQQFVKQALASGAAPAAGGLQISAAPEIDFSKFGEVEIQPLSRIQRLSGPHLHRSWVSVPHVTQFDEADITDLEAFRKGQKDHAREQGLRLTLLPFVMKACATALKAMPQFNASLAPDGENLILKRYCHIGVAVDTPEGLVVPVIRDVDNKGVFDLAAELGEVSARARDKKLMPADLQGGCFSISSLGGIGGTGFTPIINAPEVAILGVARSATKPVFQGGEFVPRLMLPLALSYDHRVIDGAAGVRFTTYLSELLADIRRLLL